MIDFILVSSDLQQRDPGVLWGSVGNVSWSRLSAGFSTPTSQRASLPIPQEEGDMESEWSMLSSVFAAAAHRCSRKVSGDCHSGKLSS